MRRVATAQISERTVQASSLRSKTRAAGAKSQVMSRSLANNPTSTDAAESTWRERLRRVMRPPRRLTFTSAGKYFVLLTIGIGFGAINTGNNLLFLLLGMMLSLITASGLLSERVIRSIHAERVAPRRIFANTPAPGRFSVHNPSRFPSLSIEVCERNARGTQGPLRGRQIGPRRVPWWKFWKFRTREKTDFGEIVAHGYTMRLDAGERRDLEARWLLPRRGRYRLPGVDIVTRFPFGLFEKRRELDEPADVVVYPAARPIDEWMTTVSARFGDVSQNKRGAGEEYFGLRDYRPGEDQRLIHWKSSARRGDVVVRESERQEQRAVEVCLLNCTGEPARRRHLVEPEFERGLGRVAGLLQELSHRGYRVGLRTLDEHVPASDESNHMDRMLATLALVELEDDLRPMPVGEPSEARASERGAVGRILVGLSTPAQSVGAGFDLVLPLDKPDGAVSASKPKGADRT